jgi:NAD(P)-dependent dehydrogenase (short-subunit alcohol dehydrogenase family)
MDRLKNKVAIITGGGSGIGAATSLLFARNGAKVMITGNKEDEILRIAREIEQTEGVASYAVHDISKEAEWKAVVDKTVSLFGTIDILVNNAGISGNLFLPLEDRTQEEFNQYRLCRGRPLGA